MTVSISTSSIRAIEAAVLMPRRVETRVLRSAVGITLIGAALIGHSVISWLVPAAIRGHRPRHECVAPPEYPV